MNQNEKMLNEKVSGAYIFRINLWELSRWAEQQKFDVIDLSNLLQSLGNALADNMDGKDVDLYAIFDSSTNVM